jgi:hypothetical protein
MVATAVPPLRPAAPSSFAEADAPSVIGPMPQAPDAGASTSFPPLEEAPLEADEAPPLPPGSPFSANRALLRDLTLPRLPNMDIPPSPPGSPPPATSKKFEQFLDLKKKGVHFNSKIAQSSALKNPGLMDKLLAFVEVDQRDQYRSTTTADLWDPTGFPRDAFKEQLRQSQTEIGQARARQKGGPVEFVAASSASRDATPARDTAAGRLTPSADVFSNLGKRKSRFDA